MSHEVDPLTGDPLPLAAPKTALEPVTAPFEVDRTKLAEMSKSELIALICRVGGAVWGVGIMTDDEAYEAACLKLLHGGLTEKDVWKALPTLKEWMDRRKGKPAQSIAMTVENKGISQLSDDRLLRLERELARITGQEAVVIAPIPGKLEDNQ